MFGYALAPGISFCNAGGRHVFLDLRADRYFCLGATAEHAFARLVAARSLSASDRDHLAALERRGMLCSVEDGACTPTPSRLIEARDSLADSPVSVPARYVAMAAAALLRARFSLRFHPLNDLISNIRRAKAEVTAGKALALEEGLAATAGAFRRAALFTGSLDQCLALSLAVMRRTLAQGFDTELVFGVKLRPFQAHAWVQAGDLLVSDPLDTVAPFTPILVV